jgi:hypothetical protein
VIGFRRRYLTARIIQVEATKLTLNFAVVDDIGRDGRRLIPVMNKSNDLIQLLFIIARRMDRLAITH